jgi:hypothetical protein
METVKRYLEILHKAQAAGDTNQVRHLEGWRAAKNTTMVLLYGQGKVSLGQVMEWAKPKPKDHLARVELELAKGIPEAVKFAQELMRFGIDPMALDRVRKARISRMEGQCAELRDQIARNRPKQLATIIRKSGAAVVVSGQSQKPLTEHELRVQIATLESENRARAKKLAEAERKRGVTVELSAEEKARLTQAHTAKPMVIK